MKVSDIAEAYEKHAEDLVRFAASQVGPAQAEDVVSTAVIQLLQSPHLQIDNLRSYLYRSVANASSKYWRTLGRRTRREALSGSPANTYEHPDPYPEIVEALALLSAQQRAVVHLAYWEDLTPSQIADRLGVSDGTVRKQLARARKRLSVDLAPESGAPRTNS